MYPDANQFQVGPTPDRVDGDGADTSGGPDHDTNGVHDHAYSSISARTWRLYAGTDVWSMIALLMDRPRFPTANVQNQKLDCVSTVFAEPSAARRIALSRSQGVLPVHIRTVLPTYQGGPMASGVKRVVVWSTGGIGSAAIRAVHRRPDLELVGVWVHAPRRSVTTRASCGQ